MSDDAKAAKELVETLRDGEKGYTQAAERVRAGDHAAWAGTLERLAAQRREFRAEIVALGHEYGDDVDESGTATATLHRGWMALKDALTGDDPQGVLGAAVTGEDHAISEYDKALEQDLSEGFRSVVERQRSAVQAARDEVKALQQAS
jgi:uncharacterized protein (TIGR02284 family)